MNFRTWCRHYFPGGAFKTAADGEEDYGPVKNPYRDDTRASLTFGTRDGGLYNDFGGRGGKVKFFCHEHGIPEVWDGAEPWTENPRKEGTVSIDYNALLKKNAAADKKAQEDAEDAAAARQVWEGAGPADGHAYLAKKGISGAAFRRTSQGTLRDGETQTLKPMRPDDLLIAPGYNVKGELVAVEQITPQKDRLGRDKFHLGAKKGIFFPCGDLKAAESIYVAEGAATAASIAQITGQGAISSFGAWNLLQAAGMMRELYPGKGVVVCPDCDDAGRTNGAKCKAAGFTVLELPPDRPKGHDWNDEASGGDIKAAQDVFFAQLEAARAARVEGPEPEPEPEPEPVEKPRRRITILHGSELRYEPKEHLVKGIIKPNSFAVIYGPSGSAKTFYCLDMALSVASGQAFLGRPTKQGPVVYIGAEGTDDIVKRLDAWDREKASREVSYRTIPFCYVPHAVTIPRDEERDELVAAVMEKVNEKLDGETPVAIFIDTLARCSEGDENSNSDMGRFVAAADEIRMRLKGATVVVVHHTPKSDPEALRGASALHGAIDTAVCLIPVGTGTEQEQPLIMKCKKQKDLGQFPDEPLARVQVELHYDNFYGERETSCIIEAREELPKEERLSRGQKAGLDSYFAAAKEKPTTAAGKFSGVLLEDWRVFYYAASTADSTDAKGKAFQRARADLVEKGILTVKDDLYSPVRPGDILLIDGYSARVEKVIAQDKGIPTGQTGHCPDMSDVSGSQNTYQPDRPDTPLRGVRCPGVLSGLEEEEKSLPCGKEKLTSSEVDFNEALTWAKNQDGLLEALEEKAKLTDEPTEYFETAVKTAYVGFLNEPDTSTLADMSPALSVAQIAARAGVELEDVKAELSRWQDCGRLSVDGAGNVFLLAGDAFPGDGGPDDEEADDLPEQEPEPALLGQGRLSFPEEGPAPGQSEKSYRLFGRLQPPPSPGGQGTPPGPAPGEVGAGISPEKKAATVEEWLSWADEVMGDE